MLELKSAVLLLIFCLLSLLLFSCLSVDYLNIRSPSWFICSDFGWVWASLVAQRVKRLPAMQDTQVRSLGGEDPLEKEMATHSSTVAWKISWTEKPGGLQSMGPHVWLFAMLWTWARQAPLSMGFSGQEYWNGLPFSSPGDLPNPGIETGSPAMQADSLPTEPTRE